MSDNPSIDPGTTPSVTVEGDDIGAGVIRQRVAIAYGSKDATTPVSSGSPLPTADAVTLAELVLILAKLNASVGVTGTFWQATQPVSGTFWQATQPVSGTVTTTPPANASTNLAQVAGGTVAQGHGTAATALRVELPTDGTGVVGLAAGAATVGTVNLGTLNGAATAAGVSAVNTTLGTPMQQTGGSVAIAGTTTLAAAAQVAMTATHATVLAAGTYKTIMIRNLSSSVSSVFVGPATVTATTGMEIKPGEMLTFGIGECPSNLIDGICPAAGTATLIVQTAS